MKSGKLSAAVLALLGVCTCGLAVFAAPQEIWWRDQSNKQGTNLVKMLEAGQVPYGLSPIAQRRTLDICQNLMTSYFIGQLTTELQTDTIENCRGLGEKIVQLSPSSSMAWLILALGDAKLGDFEAFNEHLRNSYLVASYDEDIAVVRVPMVEEYFEQVSSDLNAQHMQDIRILVASPSGIGLLGYIYLKKPDFRERLIEVVEALPATDHQRLLNAIYKASRK